MEDLNKIFNYKGKIYTPEEAKQEIFKYIDFQTELLKKELDNLEKLKLEKEYEEV